MTDKRDDRVRATLMSEALDLERRSSEFQQSLALQHSTGAIVSFTGVVRNTGQRGQPIDTLELEHYPGMTEAKLLAVAADAATQWQLEKIDVCHRIGVMRPGDTIVHVLVGASHRQEAFAACSHVVEQLKSTIPLWKKESGKSGSAWVVADTSAFSQ